jgi:hypothetical protein
MGESKRQASGGEKERDRQVMRKSNETRKGWGRARDTQMMGRASDGEEREIRE